MDKVSTPPALGGHTPGPWFVAAQNDGLVIIDAPPSPAPYDGPIPKPHGPDVVATPNWRLAEHEANARLIAAAPDILAALIALNDNIGAASLARNPFGKQLRAQADAAIAKATGKE